MSFGNSGRATVARNERDVLVRTRLEARLSMGHAWASNRQREIAALPRVEWKGKTLRTLQCRGVSGKGAHPMNLPESHLWFLIRLTRFFCVYHAADALMSDEDLDRVRVKAGVQLALPMTRPP